MGLSEFPSDISGADILGIVAEAAGATFAEAVGRLEASGTADQVRLIDVQCSAQRGEVLKAGGVVVSGEALVDTAKAWRKRRQPSNQLSRHL